MKNKKEIIIKNDNFDEIAPVYRHYVGQHNPQQAYIEIDPGSDAIRVTADYNGEIGNGVAMDYYNRLVERVAIPPTSMGSSLLEIMGSEEFQDEIREICEGYENCWDGSNFVGKWVFGVDDKLFWLEEWLSRNLRQAEIYDGETWLADCEIEYYDAHGNQCEESQAVKAVWVGMEEKIEIKEENIEKLVVDAENMIKYACDTGVIVEELEEAFETIIERLEENREEN